MYGKLSRVIERQITLIGSVIVVVVLVLWLVSEFIPPLNKIIVGGAFFNVVLVVVLFEVLHRVIDLKIGGQASQAQVSANQDEAWPAHLDFVRTHRPKVVDMIEYSGGTIVALLEELFKANPQVTVRLLLCHPDVAITGFERRRIEVSLEYFLSKLSDYPNLSVRCYRTPGSIRGRVFDGQLITVGWYTYHMRRGREELQGHLNAMVSANVSSSDGQHLRTTFNQAFDDLWSHPKTAEATTIAFPAH